MRVDEANDKCVRIRLSRRNLLTLLYQVDNCRGWDRGIAIRNNGVLLGVTPEDDSTHYADQDPGFMPYEIEEFTKLFEQRLKLYDPKDNDTASEDRLFQATAEDKCAWDRYDPDKPSHDSPKD